jgi:hypothetical protein
MAEVSAHQRSTMNTSDMWFRLDERGGPIWGSRGREFKSRQPDALSLIRAMFGHSSKVLGPRTVSGTFQIPFARAAPRALAADRVPSSDFLR